MNKFTLAAEAFSCCSKQNVPFRPFYNDGQPWWKFELTEFVILGHAGPFYQHAGEKWGMKNKYTINSNSLLSPIACPSGKRGSKILWCAQASKWLSWSEKAGTLAIFQNSVSSEYGSNLPRSFCPWWMNKPTQETDLGAALGRCSVWEQRQEEGKIKLQWVWGQWVDKACWKRRLGLPCDGSGCRNKENGFQVWGIFKDLWAE